MRKLVRRLFLITLVVLTLMAVDSRLSNDRTFNWKCTEDMSCWDCGTMGNKICGPKVKVPLGNEPK